jgi:hypothetical protein
MRLRQVALVARELEPVVEDLCSVLGLEVGFRDPGISEFGLHNAVMPVGDTFLEVVSPTREGTTAGRYLERRGGDSGYMVIVQSDDLDADRGRMKDLGVRIVWEVAFPDIATLHLHPRDVGGAIVSLDQAWPPESWRWAGPLWREKVRTDVVREIVGARLSAGDPGALARRWSQVLARPAPAQGGEFQIHLDKGVIRVEAEPSELGDGLAGLELAAEDRPRALRVARERGLPVDGDAIEICGTRILLLDA